MAKAKFTFDDESHFVVAFPRDFTMDYEGKYAIALVNAADPAKTAMYLMTRGNSENMTNIGAGIKERKDYKAVPEADRAAWVEKWLNERRTAKALATLAGEFTIRKAVSKMSPLEKEIDKLARKLIKDSCDEHKRPVPKGDDMDATVEKVLAVPAHLAKLTADATANLAAAANLVKAVDISAILPDAKA